MKKLYIPVAMIALGAVAFAQTPAPTKFDPNTTVELEYLTHTELRAKQKAGMTSVLLIAGGTEERGPQNVLGGHTIMSRYRGIAICKQLGNAFLAPVVPFAPQPTGLKENTDQPGAIEVPPPVFKGIFVAMIDSMRMNGFKDIYVMGDHGGGQPELKAAVEEAEANPKFSSAGVHVYYINDFYQKTHDDVDMYMYEHKLPIAGHGAMMETSEMLYEQPVPGMLVRDVYKTVPFDPTGQTPEQWKAARDARDARAAAIAAGNPPPPQPARTGGRGQNADSAAKVNNGLTGDPHPSSKEIGKVVFDFGVNNTVNEIKKQTAAKRTGATHQ
jgi:creatinine amidohydrolase